MVASCTFVCSAVWSCCTRRSSDAIVASFTCVSSATRCGSFVDACSTLSSAHDDVLSLRSVVPFGWLLILFKCLCRAIANSVQAPAHDAATIAALDARKRSSTAEPAVKVLMLLGCSCLYGWMDRYRCECQHVNNVWAWVRECAAPWHISRVHIHT